MTAPFPAAVQLAQAALAAGAPIVIEAEGGLWQAGRALPGAAALLARHADRAAIVSNDARHTTEQFAARLAAAGLSLPAARVLTAGGALLAAAATRFSGRRVLLLAPRALVAAAAALGVEPASDGVAAVLVADDTDLTWARLSAAGAALRRDVPCLAASRDVQAADGTPGPGAILAALAAAVPDAAVEVLGLPNPALLRHAAARAGGRGQAVLVAAPARAAAARPAEAAGTAAWRGA
jgi:ribonucleotide monophosphatase NagD (HAD superfamily)